MARLLINRNGIQELLEVSEPSSFEILWDERVSGPIPNNLIEQQAQNKKIELDVILNKLTNNQFLDLEEINKYLQYKIKE